LRLLNQPSPKYCLTQQYIKKQFDILTKSSVNIQLESSTLVLSNSTCITDNGFVEKDLQEFGSNSQEFSIYFTILDDNMFSKQVESNNNGKWYPYELKELSKLKLTSSIEPNFKQIMEII
ncbi:4238_t:CDS:2, partial [Gigaspora rosea]